MCVCVFVCVHIHITAHPCLPHNKPLSGLLIGSLPAPESCFQQFMALCNLLTHKPVQHMPLGGEKSLSVILRALTMLKDFDRSFHIKGKGELA